MGGVSGVASRLELTYKTSTMIFSPSIFEGKKLCNILIGKSIKILRMS